MTPIAPAMTPLRPPTYITVMLDGKLIGHMRSLNAPALVARLRDIKAAKLAEEESLPEGAHTIMLDVRTPRTPPVLQAAARAAPVSAHCFGFYRAHLGRSYVLLCPSCRRPIVWLCSSQCAVISVLVAHSTFHIVLSLQQLSRHTGL